MNDKTTPAAKAEAEAKPAKDAPERSYPRLCERTGRIYYSAKQDQAAQRARAAKDAKKQASKKKPNSKK